MSNRLINPAFCVLPFIEDFRNIGGDRKFCCHSRSTIDLDLYSHSNNELRQQILSGQKISHCESCYHLESKKIVSPRQRETTRWLQDPEVNQYISDWSPERSEIFFYDLRFDNKCNLACISCDEHSSSLWAKELKITQHKKIVNVDIEKISASKKIYLAGGEPLIIEDFVRLIEILAAQDTQPELVINTNLTSISDRLKTALVKIKNLTLTVSVDAFGSVNEYHRYPLRWNKFMRNLEWVRANVSCTVLFNSVVDAVTVINISNLVDIEKYADQWNLSILTHPAALQICNLPENLKLKISENFELIKNSKFYKTNYEFKSKVTEITTQINSVGNEFLLSNYIAALDSRRHIDHQQFLGHKLT
jgi:hypothetical protein